MKIGYACINMTLSKDKITTNRSMIKKTFLEKGINYASELALLNVQDMEKIIHWNVQHGIYFFRTSSNVFPWGSEYNFDDLPHINEIKTVLKRIGDYATEHGVRLTCHPGPFNVLGSPTEKVVLNTIVDLELHGRVFDMMGLSHTQYNKINIHCNGTYGNKIETLDRWCTNFNLLSDSVRSRLTIENDDKASMYSVRDLMRVYECTGIPIVFDYHHHKFCTGDMSEEDALKLAVSTWNNGITPVVHYSESKALHENDSKIKSQAHSDYINSLPNTYGLDVDIMVEAKMKELTILPYLK